MDLERKPYRLVVTSVRLSFGERARPEMKMDLHSGRQLFNYRVCLKKKKRKVMFFGCL